MMISHDFFPKLKAYVLLKGCWRKSSLLTHHFDPSGVVQVPLKQMFELVQKAADYLT